MRLSLNMAQHLVTSYVTKKPLFEGHVNYLSDERAGQHRTFKNEKMQFDDPQAEYRDWKVRQCYTLLIASTSEIENGVNNLWKKGAITGHRNHPNFSQYMVKHMLKDFKSCAYFCLVEEEHWLKDPHNLMWDVYLPCLNEFNEKGNNLLRTILLIIDESTSGWRPKTTMAGGIPKLIQEPIKHVPLGTMFWNGVDAKSSSLCTKAWYIMLR
jgi:hypothetical protein